ncbi:MAG: carboxy terminal-processing peptidase [Verrucomicrobiota bacterium]|jgi:carboxyl-terminal processing protease
MRQFKLRDVATFGLAALMCFFVAVGCVTSKRAEASQPPTPSLAGLKPDPNDGPIALWTARLLAEYHYSQQPLDTEMSGKFFDAYLETLDPYHENFLQSDLAEFAAYRTNLDHLMNGRHSSPDLTPAFAIYQRLADRMEQHAAYVNDLLKDDKFKFTGDDRYLPMAQISPLDRRLVPYPRDLDEAKQLWREHVRYDYLYEEKLPGELSATNGGGAANPPKTAGQEFASALERQYHWNLQWLTNWDSDNVLQIYLDAFAHAYDPHSDYLNHSHAQDFAIGMNLSLFGIGAQLSEDEGYCTINMLVPGGPAARSKQLEEKDRIIAVAQSNQPPVNVVAMDLPKVVQLIRGPKGTEVRLTISPESDRTARPVVRLIRDEIKMEDKMAKAQLIESPDGHGGTNRLGIIDVPSFYAPVNLDEQTEMATDTIPVTVDVTRLIKRLEREKVDGIILDLRGNPGGSLDEAIRFTGLFIKGGPVVQARNYDGRTAVYSCPDSTPLYRGPLAVMVNRFSASASEIVAAALQDYGRAIIVGDPATFGKGTVQDLNRLWPFMLSATNDPGWVKITIRKFYRVSGGSTQWKGVLSDIVLPDPLSFRNDLESERTLPNSLPYDTNGSVAYTKLNLVQPYLGKLRLDSEARRATNQDFNYIQQDIAELQKIQAEKTVTLNEQNALMEQERRLAQNKARDAERAARAAPDYKIYEFTVENCDEPGLPPPLLETNLTGKIISAGVTPEIQGRSVPVDLSPHASEVAGQAATPAAPASTNAPAAAEKITTPPVDPYVAETENILLDYISLLSKNGIVVADHL